MLVDDIKQLLDLIVSNIFRAESDVLRIVQYFTNQLLDAGRQGRREQQVLALAWKWEKISRMWSRKSHVQHFVGLVENHKLWLEVKPAAVQMVNKAAGGGYDNLKTVDGLDLCACKAGRRIPWRFLGPGTD